MLYSLARSALFALEPERAHALAFRALDAGLWRLFAARHRCPTTVMGIEFPNPVGLAAGLDKNADHLDALGKLGFGFIEVGTVTPRPQQGNPRPRMFRLAEHRAIINRLGFNNLGVDHLVAQVQRADYDGVLGINIGKNWDTPNSRAVDDYLHCLEKVYPLADYIAINISSPNTKGLRELQQKQALDRLLGSLKERQAELSQEHGRYIPMAVKIAPDMDVADIEEMAEHLKNHKIDGVIATNTTVRREEVAQHKHAQQAGGLSGKPLFAHSTSVLETLARALDGTVPIIGVGGIVSGNHAVSKVAAGADLVQIYTGFIYYGPALIGQCVKALDGKMSERRQAG